MMRNVLFVVKSFLVLLLFFALHKVLFMAMNAAVDSNWTWTDVFPVLWHGLPLDVAFTGYLIVVPMLAVLCTVFIPHLSLKRWLTPYYIIISILLSLILVADDSLYSFWGFKIDSTIFIYMDSPKDAVASVSVWYLLFRFGFWVLSTVALTCALRAVTPLHSDGVKHRVVSVLVWLLMGGLTFLGIRGGVSESTANVGMVYYSNNQFLNHSAVNPVFSLFSSMTKNERFEDEYNFYPEDELPHLVEGFYPKEGELTDTLLQTRRPNVLVIEMESVGGIFMERLGGRKGVTPNLDRLSHQGIFFTHYYSNSFRTDRGTVCLYSGYLGLPNASVMKMPKKSQTLSSIAQVLRNQGYTTDFLYGGDIDFTNMRSYLLANGYQSTTSMENFSFAEKHSNAWGVNDDITFKWLYNELMKRQNLQQPWHTAFLTLSSHEPFEVPYHQFDDKVLNSVAYTDHCLGNFIDRLSKTPLWKNLLVICVPDHSLRYEEAQPLDSTFYRAPMLWLGGAVRQPKVVDKFVNQSDVAATLLGQMGLPHAQFPFSRDVFSSSYQYPFAFSCFNDGFLFADSTGVTLYDNTSAKPIQSSTSSGEDARIRNGKAILQVLYDDLGSR